MARLNPSFTIDYHDLARLVSIVAPCASTDIMVPIFNCVHFGAHKGRVELVTTDRYTLAIARSWVSATENLNFNLPLKSIRHLLATFKPARRQTAKLAFTVGDGKVTVAHAQPTLDLTSATIDYPNVAEAFPGLRHFDITPANEPVAINAEFLRRVPITRNEPAMFIGGERGKVCAFVGADWVVYIMGMKSTDEHVGWCDKWTAKAKGVAA